MALLEDKWTRVNEILMRDAPAMEGLGLLNGKMGVCLYFFHLARETGESDHLIFAEKLLDEVYDAIQNKPLACGFGEGLAGISWALAHLIEKRFVDADVDEVLLDADDKVYQHIINTTEMNFGFLDGMMGYLTYFVSRLESTKDAHPESVFVFKRLLVELLNRICRSIEEGKWRLSEPPFLSFYWDLPLCLTLLGRARGLHLYGYKIDRIIENLAPSVLSYFPCQQVNRLYLLYGLRHILQHYDLPQWERHARLIEDQFDLETLLDKELKDKNIYFSNGLAGVSFILPFLSRMSLDQGRCLKTGIEITERIGRSEYFNSIIQSNSETKPNLGLIQGLAGVGIQFLSSYRGDRTLGHTYFLLRH